MSQARGGTGGGARSTRVPPRVADALVAIGVAVVTCAVFVVVRPSLEEQGLDVSPGRTTPVLLLAVAQSATLLLWRVRPVLGFVLAEGCQLALVSVMPDAPLRGLPLLFLAYSLGLRLPLVQAAGAAVAAMAAETAATAIAASAVDMPPGSTAFGGLLTAGVSLLLPLAVGVAVRSRTLAARLLQQQVIQDRERLLDDAIAEERRRIAGELHDVAAHHLSGMVVQAAAIERMIDRDPESAKEGAAQLRAQGKQTLNGLRAVVGLLRADGDVASVAGLRDLPELVESTRALGLVVTLHRDGNEIDLAPVVDAAVYRIAQQAISNAVQHAPGAPLDVSLSVSPQELTMRIVNDSPSRVEAHTDRAGGAGLAVMRERAALIGGRLAVGPTSPDGWQVELTLPLGSGVAR